MFCDGERRLLMLRVQVEMNRRREAELQKLQRDLEDAQSQNDAQLVTFRKKHQEVVNQLTEQLDQLHKLKQKYDPPIVVPHSFPSPTHSKTNTFCVVVTTTIRLRFDGCSTAVRLKSLGSQ